MMLRLAGGPSGGSGFQGRKKLAAIELALGRDRAGPPLVLTDYVLAGMPRDMPIATSMSSASFISSMSPAIMLAAAGSA